MDQPEKTITVKFEDEAALYRAYMPFMKGGGLFVTTEQRYEYGETVILKLQLPHSQQIITAKGKIAWMTHTQHNNHHPVGVGVQFIGNNAQEIRSEIEHLLITHQNSNQKTDTL